MRNNIARYMNTVNKNSVHEDRRRSFFLDNDSMLREELATYSGDIMSTTSSEIDSRILERYQQICVEQLPAFVLEVAPQPGDETSYIHLFWMLIEISENKEMSLTKKHRWLGFVQGVLIAHGLLTVQEERDFTRDLFKGA